MTHKRHLPWLRALLLHPICSILILLGLAVLFSALSVSDSNGGLASLILILSLVAPALATALVTRRRGGHVIAVVLMTAATLIICFVLDVIFATAIFLIYRPSVPALCC